MRVHHERCCGIDVHKRSVTACLLWGPLANAKQVRALPGERADRKDGRRRDQTRTPRAAP